MNKGNIIVLAIESSCDDTSAAVVENGKVLSNRIANQDVHKSYGGVVPELASRQHLMNIIPVIDTALKDAGKSLQDLDAIAFTRGPGLLGSLIVGVSVAKSLALSLDIPLVEVHHMMAHVLANFAEEPVPSFPFLCLTVSGGHTQIVKVIGFDDMEIIGSTRDDAAGEAFDKTGKLLGLEYPAGPIIDNLAQEGTHRFKFSEPNIDGLDFSFSGLKTSILHFLQKNMKENPGFIQENIHDICCSVQTTIVEILMKKLSNAIHQTGIRQVAIAGGVSANSTLRKAFQGLCNAKQCKAYIPAFQYCTDNAGMIGIAGYHLFLQGKFTGQDVTPMARMDM